MNNLPPDSTATCVKCGVKAEVNWVECNRDNWPRHCNEDMAVAKYKLLDGEVKTLIKVESPYSDEPIYYETARSAADDIEDGLDLVLDDDGVGMSFKIEIVRMKASEFKELIEL